MAIPLPDPETSPELFAGLLTRRVLAYLIDFTLIVCLTAVFALSGLVMGLLTLGLAWLGLPLVFPMALIVFYGLSLGGPWRATPGMSLMDITLMPATEWAMDGWKILLHPLLFWLTIWISWPVALALPFFTPRRQMIHDLLTGTLMVRRSPLGGRGYGSFSQA